VIRFFGLRVHTKAICVHFCLGMVVVKVALVTPTAPWILTNPMLLLTRTALPWLPPFGSWLICMSRHNLDAFPALVLDVDTEIISEPTPTVNGHKHRQYSLSPQLDRSTNRKKTTPSIYSQVDLTHPFLWHNNNRCDYEPFMNYSHK
jgi:hypothetical protein